MPSAIDEKERKPGVDDERVCQLGTHPLDGSLGGGIETIMVGPIVGGGGVEASQEVFHPFGLEELGEEVMRGAEERGELADAHRGERRRPHTEELPEVC